MMPPRPGAGAHSMPPIKPGVRPGRSAMEKAMKPPIPAPSAQRRSRRRSASAPPPTCALTSTLDAEHERQRDAQTAGHHHRQHVDTPVSRWRYGPLPLSFTAGAALPRCCGWNTSASASALSSSEGFLQRPRPVECGTSAPQTSQITSISAATIHQIRRRHFFGVMALPAPTGAAFPPPPTSRVSLRFQWLRPP